MDLTSNPYYFSRLQIIHLHLGRAEAPRTQSHLALVHCLKSHYNLGSFIGIHSQCEDKFSQGDAAAVLELPNSEVLLWSTSMYILRSTPPEIFQNLQTRTWKKCNNNELEYCFKFKVYDQMVLIQ